MIGKLPHKKGFPHLWRTYEKKFVKQHKDARLIIIDTLQKVREVGGETFSYSNDYEIVTKLKAFSDKYGICLLVVHHTRKMESGDSFDMISGTNGLLGAADGAFIMQKKKRTDNTAVLDIVGRDQPDQELTIVQNDSSLMPPFIVIENTVII